MPKLACECGHVISMSEIPCKDELRVISDVDMDKFTACMQTGASLNEALEDLDVAIAAELRGTPTFFINGYRFEGVIQEDTLEELLKSLNLK